MQVDLPTLMVAASFVATASGMFLIFAWLQNPSAAGPLWWAGSNIVLAISIPMIASPEPLTGSPAMVVGITLFNVGPALIWASARSCNGRRVDFRVIGAGAGLWLIAHAIPAFRESAFAPMALSLSIAAGYLFAAAHEFWRGRRERLSARWPLITLLGLHGGFAAIGAAEATLGGLTATVAATMRDWLVFVHIETLAFVVGTSIFAVAMARERSEMLQRIAASTDALTGVATRRAFYAAGEERLAISLQSDTALACVLFDLDGFKAINDTLGHGPGDEVLRVFGRVATNALRATDLIGRLGGEEFAVLLPGASVNAAYVAAERIRTSFAEACRSLNELAVDATVSAGVSWAHRNSTLDSLIKAADEALYLAKKRGRDRVEISEREKHRPLTETAEGTAPSHAPTRKVA